MPNDPARGSRSSDRRADRYRAATDDVLQQLDWCIGYLYGIRKRAVSRALARNRDLIRSRMRRESLPLPLPTDGNGRRR